MLALLDLRRSLAGFLAGLLCLPLSVNGASFFDPLSHPHIPPIYSEQALAAALGQFLQPFSKNGIRLRQQESAAGTHFGTRATYANEADLSLPDGQRVTWDETHKLITEGLIHDPSTLIFEWAASQLEIKQPSSLTATQTKIRDKLERALKELDLERDVPIRIVLLDGKTKTQRFPTLGDSVWALSNTVDDAHYLEAGAIGHSYPSVYMTRELLCDIADKTLADRLQEEIRHALEKANGVRKAEHWEDDPNRSEHLFTLRGDIQQAERYRKGILEELARLSQSPIVLSDSVEQQIRDLPYQDLQAIFARRLNLRFEDYRQLFLSLWSTNPIAAFEYLGAGVLTDQDVVGSIRELRDVHVPSWMRNNVPPPILKGRFMFQYQQAKSQTIRIEWGYFPDLNHWLPVSAATVQSDKLITTINQIRSVFVMRDGSPVYLKYFLRGLTKKAWSKLAASGNNYRIYGQVSPSGTVSLVTSPRPVAEGNKQARVTGGYMFSRNPLELYSGEIDPEGFAHRLDWEGTGESVPFMHAIKRVVNRPDQILAAAVTQWAQQTLETLTEKHETFWIRTRLPLKAVSQRSSISMQLGIFKSFGIDWGFPLDINVHNKWANHSIEVKIKNGFPVCIQILHCDTGKMLGLWFFKILEVRDREGKVLAMIRPYNSDLQPETEAVNIASKLAHELGAEVVVTNLELYREQTHYRAAALGQTAKVGLDHAQYHKKAKDAEFVFAPIRIARRFALKPIRLRVGQYNHHDPLSNNKRELLGVTEYPLDFSELPLPSDLITKTVRFPGALLDRFREIMPVGKRMSIVINTLLAQWLATSPGVAINKYGSTPSNQRSTSFKISLALLRGVENQIQGLPYSVEVIIRTLVQNYVDQHGQSNRDCLTAS